MKDFVNITKDYFKDKVPKALLSIFILVFGSTVVIWCIAIGEIGNKDYEIIKFLFRQRVALIYCIAIFLTVISTILFVIMIYSSKESSQRNLSIPSYEKKGNGKLVEKRVRVSTGFYNSLPKYILSYIDFIDKVDRTSKAFIRFLMATILAENETREAAFTYFYNILAHIYSLFDNNIDNEVRVHLRVLSGNFYHSRLIISSNEHDIHYAKNKEKAIMSIPRDEGMIKYAYKIQRSLVMSLNKTLHFGDDNDTIWKDYITIPILDVFEHNNLSIGISVRSNMSYELLLKFLSLARIENTLSTYFREISTKCDILSILKEIE